MDTADEQVLLSQAAYKVLIPIVNNVHSKGMPKERAWLFAGALLAYAGNAKIPKLIIKHTDSQDAFAGQVGEINTALRTGQRPDGMEELITLMTEGLNKLPDFVPRVGEIPTRMMDSYTGIDQHYAVGNVLVMAEVGSVSRIKPPTASQYYKRRYRLEFYGGLKDISNLNPQQQEVIYAPGSHYRVAKVKDGKVKDKKGNPGSPQSHRHIELRFIAPDAQELKTMDQDDLIDLRE